MSYFLEKAIEIATKAHEGQTRWDGETPYISHPAAVAKACRDKDYGDIIEAIAWLHDVIEDCDIHGHQLIDQGIPTNVVNAIVAMTKFPDLDESYLEYLLRVKKNELAVVVKIEDIKHNMSCFPEHKKHSSLYQKYQLALYILERNI